jgi:cytochrome c
MKRKPKLIYLNIFIPLLLFVLVTFAKPFIGNKTSQENHPPVVKITSPKNNDIFEPGAQVNYQISVADKEDGDSKYDEINTKEVLLEVKYLANKSKLTAVLNTTTQNDAPGLAVIRTSNCFNCHNFNSKLIGPSFYEISKRYPGTAVNTDSLMKHVRDGSSGIWGKEKMPTHPELTKEETKNAVQWILKHATDPNVNYYIGTEGSFHIKPSITPAQKGVYVLTASYTDHGLKSTPGKQKLKGQDAVVIYGK